MGRMIDEDELIKGRVENDPVVIAAKCTPTAYDPERVVDQLNDKFRVVRTDEDLEWNRAMDEAITIVKDGGVDGN